MARRYRKQFFARGESSAMKTESIYESSTMEVRDVDESASGESPLIDERRVVGE